MADEELRSLRARTARLAADNLILRGLCARGAAELDLLQWSRGADGPYCPTCGARRSAGAHGPGCTLRAALDALTDAAAGPAT